MSDEATKADLKELRQQMNADFKVHTGALYEKFSSDVRMLSEQSSTINKRLTTVESKLDTVIEAVADLRVESTGLRDRVRRVETRVSTLESK